MNIIIKKKINRTEPSLPPSLPFHRGRRAFRGKAILVKKNEGWVGRELFGWWVT